MRGIIKIAMLAPALLVTAYGQSWGKAFGPTLFDALQQQLGLKLVPAGQALARLFVIDRIAQSPTEN